MYICHELRKKNAKRTVNRKFIEQQPRVDDIQLFFLSGAARRDSQPRLIESPPPEKNILGESLPIAAFFHYRGSRLSRLKFLRDEWKTLATSLDFVVASCQITLGFYDNYRKCTKRSVQRKSLKKNIKNKEHEFQLKKQITQFRNKITLFLYIFNNTYFKIVFARVCICITN